MNNNINSKKERLFERANIEFFFLIFRTNFFNQELFRL